MTNRERQVELSKIVGRLEKAVRQRDVRALVVVALRHDGQYEHGTVVTGEDVGKLIATVGHALKGVVAELERQQAPLDKQAEKG